MLNMVPHMVGNEINNSVDQMKRQVGRLVGLKVLKARCGPLISVTTCLIVQINTTCAC